MTINENYEKFYAARKVNRVYPTELVVRIFLAKYPELKFTKPEPGSRLLDIGFGDGRNVQFLCEQGYDVAGVEITPGIVNQVKARMETAGYKPNLQVGRNSALPFADRTFDGVLASSSLYYCDKGQTLRNNLEEISRVIKPGGSLIASVTQSESYIFKNAIPQKDGTLEITEDPYGNRTGYRLHPFKNTQEIVRALSTWFGEFSFATSNNNYFGIDERLIWFVCKRA